MEYTKTRIGAKQYEYRGYIVSKGVIYWKTQHNGEMYTQKTLSEALKMVDRMIDTW